MCFIFWTEHCCFFFYETLNREGKKEQAFKVLQDGLDKYPDNVLLLRATAEGYMSINRYGIGITYYEKVLKQEPGDEFSLKRIGKCYLKLRKYKEAEAYYNEALKSILMTIMPLTDWEMLTLAWKISKKQSITGINPC